jgi:regulator of protease activity HflC (stomatin/prohibitin superfamily)
MRGDFHKYGRAAGLCVLGAVVQTLMAAAMLVYAALGIDTTATSIAIFMGFGVPAWIVLAIVFDQQRRVKLEELEAQTVSADRIGSSAFEATPEEFKVAARRLASMERWLVPIMGILLGGAMLAMSIWRTPAQWTFVTSPEISVVTSRHIGWGLGLGLFVAFVGFVFARYISGLAKQPEWKNLRAGSAFAVGGAVLSLALAVGHFVDYMGPDAVLRWVNPISWMFMGLIGAEFLLNFVLDLYRPRKAGESRRPAFDSRLLGFLAAPDRIAKSISDAVNYQLGFDFTSGWLYQLLTKAFWPLVVTGVVVTWGLSSMAVLQPHQKGTILRFGKPVRENIGPGLHFKMPWPIETVYVPEYIERDTKTGRMKTKDLTATGVRTLELGTSAPATTEPLMWTNDHVGVEVFQLVQSGSGAAIAGGVTDLSLVSIEVPLRYAVDDVAKFDRLAPADTRDELLRSVAKREVTLFFQTVSLEQVLGKPVNGVGRPELSDQLRDRINKAFAAMNPGPDGKPLGAGVSILSCAIVGAHPPKNNEVAQSYEKVIEAQQRFKARLDAAEADRIESLTKAAGSVETARTLVGMIEKLTSASDADKPTLQEALDKQMDNAGGYAAQTLASARAKRWERHMSARGLAARHAGRIAVWQAAPELFYVSEYFASLSSAMADSRVYIVSDSVRDPRIDLDLMDIMIGADTFRASEQEGN